MSDKIYIVIWEDRHTDVTVHPFTDPDEAIAEAKRIAMEAVMAAQVDLVDIIHTLKQYADKYDDEEYGYEEPDFGEGEGWLFYATYSCEGDCTRVIEVTMDKKING